MILWRMKEGVQVDLQNKGVVWKHSDGRFLLSFVFSHCRWLTEKERIELWRKKKYCSVLDINGQPHYCPVSVPQ